MHLATLSFPASQFLIESHSLFQIPGIGMPFGDTAYQLEGTEGIIAFTAESPQYWTAFSNGDLPDGLGVAGAEHTVGIDEKYRLPFRKILAGKPENALLKIAEVNAGSNADTVVSLQSGG